jgi:hypothetical protein
VSKLKGALEKRRGWVGTCGEDGCPLFGGSKKIGEKNKEMGGPLALDGRHLMRGHNNQPKVVIDGEGGVGEETRPGRNMWGTLSHCLGCRMEKQKIK